MKKLPFFNQLVDESKPAIYWREEIYQTYGGLIAQVDEWLDRLESTPRKLIVFYASQHPDSIAVLIACLASKHAVLLATDSLSIERRQNLEKCYQPQVVIQNTSNGYSIRETGSKPFSLYPELCLLLSTSGSTGTPRSVRLTAGNLLENASAIATVLSIDSHDNALAHLEMSYSYGLSVINSHLIRGASLTVTSDKMTDKIFWQTIEKTVITHFPGVPYHYEVMCRLGLERLPLDSINTFTQAGGRLSEKFRKIVVNYAQSVEARFYIMYGQTEAAPRMSTLQPEMYEQHKDTVGQALPGGEFTIRDQNNEILLPGVEGEIVYRGPNVMLGYGSSKEDLALGDELRGELHTGDTGHMDSDGFLTVTGRDARMGKLFGWRVNLDEIEKDLEGSFNACVVQRGDKLVVCYQEVDEKVCGAAIDLIVEKYALPVSVFEFVELASIPVNSRNKTDYKAVLEIIENQVQK